VNLINGLPSDEFRHCVIALTEASEFRRRIVHPDTTVYELHKRPGKDPGAYFRLYRLLRASQPQIVHTRNIGTMDCTAVAMLAGIRTRIHGEHGWDTHDPDGTSRKYLAIRRTLGRIVSGFVTVSADLERWLTKRVGVPLHKVRRICNGVDTERFVPGRERTAPASQNNLTDTSVVLGSVTRFSEIKDPLNAVRAFIIAREELLARDVDLRLLMAGDGPLRSEALRLLEQSGHRPAASLPGSCDDVPQLLSAMDIFVLGSRREGISNTVLEAMASGLPVVATQTGGNVELIQPGRTGAFADVGDPNGLARAIVTYALDRDLRQRHGAAARQRATQEYSLARMLRDYRAIYLTYWERMGVIR